MFVLNVAPVITDVGIPEIVGHDENNVRLIRSSCRDAQQAADDGYQREDDFHT